MSNPVLKETALENLREFQEMSYADVSALISQRRFEEAKAKYQSVFQSLECTRFDAVLNLEITANHDDILEAMSNLAGEMAEPEKLAAVGFDLSWHALYENDGVICDQGIEINLYSNETYDFTGASEDELREQCHSLETVWQGAFVEMTTMPLSGLGALANQFYNFALQEQDDPQYAIETEAGNWIVNPDYVSRHVAKLLMAVAYHDYMAGFVAQVDVPASMIFIIGEHDEIEVPVTHYRVEPNMAVAPETNDSDTPAADEAVESVEHSHVEETVLDDIQTPPIYDEPIEELPEPAAETAPSPVEEYNQFGSVDAKSKLGLPIEPKPFGQRTSRPNLEDTTSEFVSATATE